MCPALPRDHLIESVVDRCMAFADQLDPLKLRQYTSDFPRSFLNQLSDLSLAVKEKVERLTSDPDFRSLDDEEAEQHVLRYSILYSYLYLAASFVERSDVPHTVVELVQPIKRLMQLQCGLTDFQLLLHPLPILNYSFFPLGSVLSSVQDQLNLGITFPKQLVTVGFPGLEVERLLLHSIIAHELGHCLYIEHELERSLLPLVTPVERELDALVREWAETKVSSDSGQTQTDQRTVSEYFTEVELRSYITRQINEVSEMWVKELTCDAIGYCLFGPAYLFSALDVLPSAFTFDNDQGTHPTNRMRFLLLFRMLEKETGFFEIIDQNVLAHLESWKSITHSRSPQFTLPIRKLAGVAILDIYDSIIATATSTIESTRRYSVSEDTTELQRLIERASSLIPPNEFIENGIASEAQFQSILNAGWLVYLSGLEGIRERFGWDKWESKIKFNEFISRAIELNEIQRRWREIR